MQFGVCLHRACVIVTNTLLRRLWLSISLGVWHLHTVNTCYSQEFKVYKKLRVERMNARMEGTRKKRAEEEAAAEKDKA